MLNGVPGFVRGNPERRHRWCIVNVTGKAKLFLGRIVMVPQKIVRLHDLDIVNLRRLQNLARTFRPRDVGACAHLAPTREGAAYTNLRPNADDQRNAYIKEPVTSAESNWVEHSCFKCVCRLDAADVSSVHSPQRAVTPNVA